MSQLWRAVRAFRSVKYLPRQRMAPGGRPVGRAMVLAMARTFQLSSAAFAASALLLCAGNAAAHLALRSPEPRLAGDATSFELKTGPCGQQSNGRTATVNMFAPGATITVEWEEFVSHPSYYRIAFDVDGDDDFPVRADMNNLFPGVTNAQEVMAMDDPEAAEPLSDVILKYVYETDSPGPMFSTTVTLPAVECDNCTLQVVQFMYDKQNAGGDDEYYFQCADITLSGEPVGTGGAGGTGGSGGMSSGGSGGTVASGAGGSAVDSGAGGTTGGAGGSPVSSGGATATSTGTGGVQSGAGGAASGGTGGNGVASTGTTGMTGTSDAGGGCSLASKRRSPASSMVWLVLGALSLLGLGRRRG